MHLYHCERIGTFDYDEMFACVVRAKSSKSARAIAAQKHKSEDAGVWLDKSKSTCKRIRIDGEPGLLVADVRWG